ncbi:3-deoxy-D-manno-octulosonic acid transferase [Haloflavibacter putidus]|uniref:3-deoxy-D-manno-octulosonic acid transferase n=1 Tax=Haloflavibacter putidus TaxID=2576776 RepID=UPI001F23B06B|nr:glycosyltransferase N-terminal domain-containing protein [Haloflavibacter putidus]
MPVIALFSSKLRLFVSGRKNTFTSLRKELNNKPVIWVHAASLGEYEQAVPILNRFRKNYSQYQILVSFFSPSGYEIKKNTAIADAVCYLPLDTKKNAKQFIKIVQPKLAIFIKYEVWPNYLAQLQQQKIPCLLVSGLFRKDQHFFKSYGKFMRKVLERFTYIFVQDKNSLNLLKNYDFRKVAISGDTRFDRVSAQLKIDNKLAFAEEFVAEKPCLVCGSTWPEDETYLSNFINNTRQEAKYIIAPHQIEASKIKAFQKALKKPSILYSEIEGQNLNNFSVLIIDTIGLLSKLYNYADVAYVGGAMGNTGLHNILEPATFGVPIVIGKNFEKFPEAKALQTHDGLFSVKDQQEMNVILQHLLFRKEEQEKAGQNAKDFVIKRTGATTKIMDYISEQALL